MSDSNYFKTLTAPFRAADVAPYVTFNPGGIEIGFSYIGPGSLAFQIQRTSKNNYVLRVIYAGKFEEKTYGSQSEVIEYAVKLLNLDKSGVFRARKTL